MERPSRSRTDYVVKARSQFKERSVATNVEIILPLPNDATAPVTRCSQVSNRQGAMLGRGGYAQHVCRCRYVEDRQEARLHAAHPEALQLGCVARIL